jgi:hypothetical protein
MAMPCEISSINKKIMVAYLTYEKMALPLSRSLKKPAVY